MRPPKLGSGSRDKRMDDGRRNDLDRRPGRQRYILSNLARTALIREAGLFFSGIIVLYDELLQGNEASSMDEMDD